MARRLKLLTGLSSLALTGALTLSACAGGEGEGVAKSGAEAAGTAQHDAAAGGEAEGEGAPLLQSGGESEGAALVDVAHDKAAFISALQIVRGHLRAGDELYASGDREMGAQHLRHPQAEILTTLAPAFASYGAADFESAIDALASAGENGGPPAQVSALHTEAVHEIMTAAAAANATLAERLLAVAKTLTVAGDEYSVAVVDGKIDNLHEYHDAYGFIATAIGDIETMKGDSATEKNAIARVLEQAKIAQTAAPTVTPPAELAPASVIYGAAARIEIAARGL
jgi:hypothetical protein